MKSDNRQTLCMQHRSARNGAAFLRLCDLNDDQVRGNRPGAPCQGIMVRAAGLSLIVPLAGIVIKLTTTVSAFEAIVSVQ